MTSSSTKWSGTCLRAGSDMFFPLRTILIVKLPSALHRRERELAEREAALLQQEEKWRERVARLQNTKKELNAQQRRLVETEQQMQERHQTVRVSTTAQSSQARVRPWKVAD